MQDVTKEEVIVVCDPYGLANISGTDISGDNKGIVIALKAKVAADELAAALGGSAAKAAVKWIENPGNLSRDDKWKAIWR